ncbi:MAG TPA: ABC transporter ATP-binding protein [Chthoniobacterales bacterium]
MTDSPQTWVFEGTGVEKKFDNGKVQALRGVDFGVRRGESVAICGPSGSGKTTLLQMLGALDRPSAGTLLYCGKPIPSGSDSSEYRAQEIGFVFQSFHLLPTFTALENVQIPMFETKWGWRERRERAKALLNGVGLEARLHHLPAELSGGERQRVAIARSLANEPSVLLADEPTGNLDSENGRVILDLLARFQSEKNVTLVLVTHDQEVARHASRVIRMSDGRILSGCSATGDGAKL